MTLSENLKDMALVGVGASFYPTVKSWVERFVGGMAIGGVGVSALVTAVISAYAMNRVGSTAKKIIGGIGVGALAELIGTFLRPGAFFGPSSPAPAPVVSSPEAEAIAYAGGVG